MKTWSYYMEQIHDRLVELKKEKENRTKRYLDKQWIFEDNIKINETLLNEFLRRSNLQ